MYKSAQISTTPGKERCFLEKVANIAIQKGSFAAVKCQNSPIYDEGQSESVRFCLCHESRLIKLTPTASHDMYASQVQFPLLWIRINLDKPH